MEKRIEFSQDYVRHECQTWQEGDWIIFQCPTCGYSRKFNYLTKEMVILKAGDKNALHGGMHRPVSQTSLVSLTDN